MSSVYQVCAASHAIDDTSFDNAAMFQCLSDQLESQYTAQTSDLTSWLLILAAAMVLFMQVGFAVLCAGCVRRKNVKNTMLKNLLDACGAALAYYCVGYAFAFGGQNDDDSLTFLVSAASVTIVAGTLAERCQMTAYFFYSLLLAGFVYPVVAHTLWSNHGFLSAFAVSKLNDVGCIDFAGSGAVHLTGGTAALMATWILGARNGRFTDSRGRQLAKPKEFPGHSIALQLMGTMMLWFGWYGLNPGSALILPVGNRGQVAGLTAANTTLSAAAGAITALFTHMYCHERRTGEVAFSLTMAMNGCLSGLVAIAGPCGTVDTAISIIIGIVAGWIYMAGSKLLLHWRLDDAVDAIPVHMFNGAWGMLATGLFSAPSHTMAAFGKEDHVGWFYELARGDPGDINLLTNQLYAIWFVFGWVTVTMLPFFVWLNCMGWLRSDSLEELVGLDMSYHGGHWHHDEEDEVVEESILAFRKRKQASVASKRRSLDSTDEHFVDTEGMVAGHNDQNRSIGGESHSDDEVEDARRRNSFNSLSREAALPMSRSQLSHQQEQHQIEQPLRPTRSGTTSGLS